LQFRIGGGREHNSIIIPASLPSFLPSFLQRLQQCTTTKVDNNTYGGAFDENTLFYGWRHDQKLVILLITPASTLLRLNTVYWSNALSAPTSARAVQMKK
jgi:hypothetical protein